MDSLNVAWDALLPPYGNLMATFIDFPEPRGCNNRGGDQSIFTHTVSQTHRSKFVEDPSRKHLTSTKMYGKGQPLRKFRDIHILASSLSKICRTFPLLQYHLFPWMRRFPPAGRQRIVPVEFPSQRSRLTESRSSVEMRLEMLCHRYSIEIDVPMYMYSFETYLRIPGY